MKILHVLDHSLPLHSGYTFRSQSIFRAQQARGWQPIVVTSPKHEQSWQGAWSALEEINGCRYYRTGKVAKSRLPLLTEWQLMQATTRRILDVAASETPDLLHAHSPVLNAFPALRAGRLLRLPVVYEIRAFWEDAGVDQGTYREGSPKYRLVRALETRACLQADQVAILCNGLKSDLLQRGIPEGKITPVFNGVDPEDFQPSPPDQEYLLEWRLTGKTVIGFIGSFFRFEGLDLLIRVFASLCAKRDDIVLLLVGGGEVEPALKALAAELDLGERVIMPGRIPHERIPGVYALVDVLVYPRYPLRLTELVTPLKPLEAMAMGKALVASDVGGHKELIRHNETGLLFTAGDGDALTAQLERVLDDHGLRAALQQQGRAWVCRQQTWEQTTAVYQEIYGQALAIKGRGANLRAHIGAPLRKT